MKVLIIDFDDSFTFNLAELCESWGIEHQVLPYDEISESRVKQIKPHTIIWGPGPGHPDEYQKASNIIKQIQNSNIYQIGICLGHQLLMKSLGFEIVASKDKKHGTNGNFLVPEWIEFDPEYFNKNLEVQYYSSLAVLYDERLEKTEYMLTLEDGLITSGKGANLLSFQFHPESVGTSCPEAFFYGWRKTLI